MILSGVIGISSSLVSVKCVEAIARMHIPRVYALIHPQRRPDRLLQIRLEQMAGQVIHKLSTLVVPVHVVFLPSPQCTVYDRKTVLEQKQCFYWHNRVRNQHIATVAMAIASKDADLLLRLGLPPTTIQAVQPEATLPSSWNRLSMRVRFKL